MGLAYRAEELPLYKSAFLLLNRVFYCGRLWDKRAKIKLIVTIDKTIGDIGS